MSSKLHRLWHKQAGKCFYCGCDTYLPGSGETKVKARLRLGIEEGSRGAGKRFRRRHATIEHLLRKADGGTLAQHNIVMACLGDNVRRGARSVAEYKLYVQELVRQGNHPTIHAPDIQNKTPPG